MSLPKKITPCPILESIIEIRFEPCVPRDAVFGMIYPEVSKKYSGDFERLPILQLPEPIRNTDPNFQFSPEYRTKLKNISFSIGPKVLAISCVAPYIGWKAFSIDINETLGLIEQSKVVKAVHRIGLRYINFFEKNIFENIKLKITLDNNKIANDTTYFRTTMNSGSFVNLLQIANQAGVNVNGKNVVGSIIDIDTALEGSILNIGEINAKLLENIHNEEKRLFYSLLNDDLLKKYKPEY